MRVRPTKRGCDVRQCYECKQYLPVFEFYNLTTGYCKTCSKKYSVNYRKLHGKELNQRKHEHLIAIKELGLVAYGSKCSCCGESNSDFLTIEHINGRDKTIKRRTGLNEWRRLHSLGFPKEGITILCYNCNCSKGVLGYCSHAVTAVKK